MANDNQNIHLGRDRQASLEWPSDITPEEVETLFSSLLAFRAFLELQASASAEKTEVPTTALPPFHNVPPSGWPPPGDSQTAAGLRLWILKSAQAMPEGTVFKAGDFDSLCSDKIRVKNAVQQLIRSAHFDVLGRGEYRLAPTCRTTTEEA